MKTSLYCGEVVEEHCLVRVVTPSPQVLEHCDQVDHSAQPSSWLPPPPPPGGYAGDRCDLMASDVCLRVTVYSTINSDDLGLLAGPSEEEPAIVTVRVVSPSVYPSHANISKFKRDRSMVIIKAERERGFPIQNMLSRLWQKHSSAILGVSGLKLGGTSGLLFHKLLKLSINVAVEQSYGLIGKYLWPSGRPELFSPASVCLTVCAEKLMKQVWFGKMVQWHSWGVVENIIRLRCKFHTLSNSERILKWV